MAPEVVVVIPCYREPVDRIRLTVESAMNTRNVTRVVVVDDGCNDEALDVLHDEYACLDERAVTVMHLPENGGCSVALNAGIRAQPGDSVICRLDVGDLFYPDAKARQIDAVLAGVLCSSSPHFDPVRSEPFRLPRNWASRIYADGVFTGCTNVYRKTVWARVGGHDESLRYCADWDFSMKVQHAVGWHIHDEVTCSAGMFPGGLTDRANADPLAKKRRDADQQIVIQRGRLIGRQRGLHP